MGLEKVAEPLSGNGPFSQSTLTVRPLGLHGGPEATGRNKTQLVLKLTIYRRSQTTSEQYTATRQDREGGRHGRRGYNLTASSQESADPESRQYYSHKHMRQGTEEHVLIPTSFLLEAKYSPPEITHREGSKL